MNFSAPGHGRPQMQCGNVSNASQTINVDDTTPPVISALPAQRQ
jgi:hypothetical protein